MHANVFVGIGECMVELAQTENGLLRKSFAGDVFNTLWYARAGFDDSWTTRFMSAVGTDTVSGEMLSFFEDAGIDCSAIQRLEDRRPGLYMIHLDEGERSFSYWRDASAARLLAADRDKLTETVEAADAIYFSGITLAILPEEDALSLIACLKNARSRGKTVAFDSNIRPALWQDPGQMKQLMHLAAGASTICLPSCDDEQRSFGDTSGEAVLARYAEAGAGIIVLKDGSGDVLVRSGDGVCRYRTEHVANPVDTTGAGDSFNGAFLAEFLQTSDIARSIAAGQQCAARVIQHHGALVTL
ncbi:PfkB family carbohydrate kinase [Anderseniella sp. Alg231-50]|uniref:PfkB family carbohydrate kinase n=1 Tax=Anderseniella sp. Alg231-50 TaxID=1922226 RepID=UPI000D54DD8F